MSVFRRVMTACCLCVIATAASAQNKPDQDFTPLQVQAAREDPKAFTIDETSIRIENLGPVVNPKKIGIPEKKDPPKKEPGGKEEDPLVIIDKIINLAEKIWGIIEKNKPVVNVQTQYATATPEGIKHWTQLQGWKPPKGTVYGFYAKNTYGVTVINVRYQVLRTIGGNYKGKGKYLTAVTIEPLTVDVMWGYKFSLSAEVPDSSVINVGTEEDPVAGMTPILKWTIATVIKESQGRSLYFLQGDGLFQEVGGPFQRNYQQGVADAMSKALKVSFQ